MNFKMISSADAARIAALPLDYDWDVTTGNDFLAATEEDAPRLWDALSALNLRGAADLTLGATEWCLARTRAHVDPADGVRRLQAAWAATVDARYAILEDAPGLPESLATPWSRPERLARRRLFGLCDYIAAGRTSKVRQTALGMVLLAEHLCGRDPAFAAWLTDVLRAKRVSSPRRADDVDFSSRDSEPPTPQELTLPSREERLAGLDPSVNPYLRSAAAMAGLGFIGNPYPQDP